MNDAQESLSRLITARAAASWRCKPMIVNLTDHQGHIDTQYVSHTLSNILEFGGPTSAKKFTEGQN